MPTASAVPAGQRSERPDRAKRGTPPRDERADAHEEDERQPERDREEVVVRGADGHRDAAHRLRDKGVDHPPEHRQREGDQEQVVVEEGRLAGHERLEPRARPEQREPVDDQGRRGRGHDSDEAEEPGSDRGLREAVDRVDHAASRQEGAEERQAERAGDEHGVPDPQHVLLLLHHHRVEIGGGDEPRHQRGVLDRVPRVPAAPTHLLVGPFRTEEDGEAEERPRGERPAACGDDPALVRAAGGERAHREGEGDGEADVAEVEERRVREHVGVLQARVHARPVRGRNLRLEGRSDEDEQKREEARDRAEDRHRPRDAPCGSGAGSRRPRPTRFP